MIDLRVRVRVDEDNTRRVMADIDDAVEVGIAAAVPLIVALADRRIRNYSGRIADGLFSTKLGPAIWLIVGGHHASHIAESGSRHAPAHPFLVPALLDSRGTVAKKIHEAHRG
jgi:hypothetical protein